MKLRNNYNRFRTPVSVHRCDACGAEFTVCPPAKNDSDWDGCMAENCDSYDPSRDIDKLFDGGSPNIKWEELPPRAAA